MHTLQLLRTPKNISRLFNFRASFMHKIALFDFGAELMRGIGTSCTKSSLITKNWLFRTLAFRILELISDKENLWVSDFRTTISDKIYCNFWLNASIMVNFGQFTGNNEKRQRFYRIQGFEIFSSFEVMGLFRSKIWKVSTMESGINN